MIFTDKLAEKYAVNGVTYWRLLLQKERKLYKNININTLVFLADVKEMKLKNASAGEAVNCQCFFHPKEIRSAVLAASRQTYTLH